MQTITRYLLAIILGFYVTQSVAQDTIQEQPKEKQIADLEALKLEVETEEKAFLKEEVAAINKRVEAKEITYEEAENLKQEVAKKRALNIESRQIIIANHIDLVRRNGYDEAIGTEEDNRFLITIGAGKKDFGIKGKQEPVKYDIRTSNDFVFAAGINNAIIDGQSLSDSPYKLGGSGFVELGWNWKTRLFRDSNFARVKYGFSFQWNKYDLKDNKFFVQTGNTTTIETFPSDLKQAKFRTTNLVFPLYFEFGPSKRVEKKDRIRYFTDDHFKFGIGGYGGFNIGAKQKLLYEEDGDRVKQKIKKDYNVNPFVYGVGAYVGVGDISLYAKYDLSDTFRNNTFKQNNVSLGVRIDLD
ncbi:hypothetical protein [Lacinutrix sp. Hel_I_90]|uniref:hypothetical protein n=1 Tax=Lacinutrix sp. Hel_I_90 TaxID=1249999 RepID=UPI0005C9A0AA|nr:hypothetical protein [Lacinutrix sp. Hel_I_90]